MRDAVIALLNAIQMEVHNEEIFKGKWKKGSKAWSGDFVAKMRKEAIEKGNAALASSVPTEERAPHDAILEAAAMACETEASKYSQRGQESASVRGALSYAAGTIRRMKHSHNSAGGPHSP